MRNNSTLSIDLNLFEKNINLVRGMCPSLHIIFMVKANAYGHGMIEMTRFAYELGIREFGVATLFEAIELRKNLPYLEFEIYVFSDLELKSRHVINYKELNIIPVLHSIDSINDFIQNSDLNKVPLVLKFDTGMNRLGIKIEEIDDVIKVLKQNGRDEIEHLMTHFACSYFIKKDGDRTSRQISAFENVLTHLKSTGFKINKTSFSNSGAIEQNILGDCTHVRPGLMMYGPQSTMTSDRVWRGHNISQFESIAIKKVEIKKGTPIGYGANAVSDDGVLFVLPVGYGDGVLTFYSGATVNCGDQLGRIVGRINMDMTYVLFKDKSLSEIKDDKIFFWDHNPRTVEELSNQIKTIPYQLFCALNERIPRLYQK